MKSFTLIVLVTLIALLLFGGLVVAREAPHFISSKISSIFIGKNWPSNPTDTLTLSGKEFTCQPDEGTHWACEVMLEGKRLEMTASYMLEPYQSLTGCAVVYDGKPIACEVTLGYGWQAMLMVKDDLGISAARMAELRAQRPLIHMNEFALIWVSSVWATGLAFLVVLVLLTTLNKKPTAMFLGVRVPIWALCLAVLVFAAILNRLTVVFFVFPLGIIGTLVLLVVIGKLNNRDRKQSFSLAHPLMWASVSLVTFWVTNIATFFALLMLGFVD